MKYIMMVLRGIRSLAAYGWMRIGGWNLWGPGEQ